jgi:type IV pilus assembly protein PilW
MTGVASVSSGTPKTRAPSGNSAGGFSLIELMVAMAIASVVLTAVYTLHAAMLKSYTTQNAAADAQEAMRAGIDLMAEDLLMAGLDPMSTGAFGIVTAATDSIRFTSDRNMNGILDDSDLEDIQYFLRGTQLIQELYGVSTTDDVLVDNVTSLTFVYYNGAGTLLVAPYTAQLRDIRTIELSMTVQAPAGRDKPVTRKYTTRFRCRNIGL